VEQSPTLWCGLGGVNYYPRPDQTDELLYFLDRCRAAGISSLRFYFGFVHYGDPAVFRLENNRRPFEPGLGQSSFELYPSRQENDEWDPFTELVKNAHERDIEVWGYTSPIYQGSLQANPHSPTGERLPYLFLSEFADRHPDYWARTSDGIDSLEREGYVILDLSHLEVRQHLSGVFSRLVKEKGLDGLELEWIIGKESSSPYIESASKSTDQTTWSDPVELFIKQLGQELPTTASLSIAVNDDPVQSGNWGYEWPFWCHENLVDTVVLRHTTTDLTNLANKIRQAKVLCGNNTSLISQLNCWNKTGFRDAYSLIQAAWAARQAGTGQVGIYRSDAVKALDLWPAITEISKSW
jgi:hypothetical protein